MPAHRALMLALLVGLVVRIAAFWLVGDSPLMGDQREYAFRSSALAEGKDVPGESKRPPAIIWVFAAARSLTGGGDPRFVNVLLGCLTIAFVGILGRRLGGPRVGAIAAFTTALYPVLALYDVSYWSEPLYLAITLGALLLVSPPDGPPRTPALLLAGLLCGAAALTREVGAAMPVVGALWLVHRGGWRSRRTWGQAAVLLAASAAVLAPWSVRQTRAEGELILVSRTNGLNLYMGNVTPEGGPEEFHRRSGNASLYESYHALGRNRAERERAARELAREAILDRMPAWPLEKVVEMVPDLLTPAPLPVGRLVQRPDDDTNFRRWVFVTPVDGTRAEWIRDALAVVIVAGWVVIVLSGTAGLALCSSRPIGLLLLYIGFHVLSVVVTYAGSRYRLPLVPLLIAGGAWLAVHGAPAWSAATRRRRLAVAVVTLLVAVAVASEWRSLLDPRWA